MWRISEVQPDLRGSLIVPPTVKSSCADLGVWALGIKPSSLIRTYRSTVVVSYTKKSGVWGKIKIGIFACFLRKIGSFRSTGGFC
jgi:hypothetical protein